MRKIREEIYRNEDRFRQLSDKVDKNKMADAEMAAELQSLHVAATYRLGSEWNGDLCTKDRKRNGNGTRADARKRRRKKKQ